MDYDFLLNYVNNHCELLKEMTEENKKYFKRVKCFFGDWEINYEEYADEKVYVDKIDPSIYYRVSFEEGKTRGKKMSVKLGYMLIKKNINY